MKDDKLDEMLKKIHNLNDEVQKLKEKTSKDSYVRMSEVNKLLEVVFSRIDKIIYDQQEAEQVKRVWAPSLRMTLRTYKRKVQDHLKGLEK